MTTDRDDAVTAGRGFLLIAAAKVWFMLTSAVLSLGLPRFFGDPARFGDFKVVYSLVSVANMVLILGTIQTVSKLASERNECARALRRVAVRLQSLVGLTLAATVWLTAPAITGWVFNDEGLADYLRVGAIVSGLYAVYGVFVGILNGLEKFRDQALLDMLFSTLKVSLIAGLVLAGFGVIGAFAGFATATTLTVIVGVLLVARHIPESGSDEPVELLRMVKLLAPLLGTTLMINLVLQLDVMAVKALVKGVGTESASKLAGLFGGAKNISLLPYQATFALTLIVFPMLSRATFSEDRERSATFVRQSMRFTLLIAGAACVPLVSVAEPLLAKLLGEAYGVSAEALSILLPTTVFTGLLVLALTILNAAGHERKALVVAAVAVATDAVLLKLLLTGQTDEAVLLRAAWASCGATLVGVTLAAWVVYRSFDALVPPATVARVVAAGAAVIALSTLWPVHGIITVVAKAAIAGMLFLLGVAALGEITQTDVAAIHRIIGRRET